MAIKIIDIGEVRKQSGYSASTLRYYEEKGLIQSAGRNGLRRLYSSDILIRLDLITLARRAGFTLDEIADMLTPYGPRIDRKKLLSKADEIDQTIKKLTAMRDGLMHTANCPAPNHFECPTFQNLLRIARKSEIRKQRKKSRTS